ncbi:DUF2249 domain-containing protein [Haladaptatus sp. NG-WS-4]
MTADVHELDVRRMDEPFDSIVSAVSGLGDDQSLVLVSSFEPKPLYSVLEERGFQCETERIDADEWHVSVTRA